jgi:hypothetical protein
MPTLTVGLRVRTGILPIGFADGDLDAGRSLGGLTSSRALWCRVKVDLGASLVERANRADGDPLDDCVA